MPLREISRIVDSIKGVNLNSARYSCPTIIDRATIHPYPPIKIVPNIVDMAGPAYTIDLSAASTQYQLYLRKCAAKIDFFYLAIERTMCGSLEPFICDNRWASSWISGLTTDFALSVRNGSTRNIASSDVQISE